ncbi:MAG: hypothetical protein AB1640_15355 [bacterium]
MRRREGGIFLALLLLLLAAGGSDCGGPDKIAETWTGPGDRDEKIVPIEPREDAVHPTDDKGYVEHWYFDARLDNGYVVVGFLWASEMMTHEPAMELHIYRPSGEKVEVTRSYAESDLRASEEKCDVWVGKNHAEAAYPEGGGGLPVYHLYLSEGGLEADLTFHSELPGWKPGGGKTFYGDQGFFAWVVAVPRARVEGTIRIGQEVLSARGIGYHDHNWETADLKKVVSHWYWGRLYTDDFTLLYAYVKTNRRFGGAASKPLMLAYKDRIVYSTGEMVLEESGPTFHPVANREYPNRLEIAVPEKLSLTLEVRDVIDAHDFLQGRNPALQWAVHTFVGRPGWFRFHSAFTLKARVDGTPYERTGETLHEMVALR